MSEATQTTNLDATINFLKQDLASVDIPLALNYIAQWEHELQGTEIFQDLMQLKQSILDGNVAEFENLLKKVVEHTNKAANDLRSKGSTEAAAKVEQIAQLLSQASNRTNRA